MTAAAEPCLLQEFFNYGNVAILDKTSKAALRLCNKQGKDQIDATITACKVKPYDLLALLNCNWPLIEIKVVSANGYTEPRMPPASFTSVLFDLFSKFPLLEKLLITAAYELEELPENIGDLSQLQELVINEGYELEALPPSFAQLSALERLELSSCNLLTLDEFGPLEHLTQLTRLKMHGDIIYEPMFPGWLCSCDFPLLEDLCLGHGLSIFPPGLADFNNLTQLILRFENAPEIDVPESINALSSLQKLDLSSEQPISFPDSFSALTSLKKLWISAPVDKKNIAQLQYLTGLTELQLSRFCNGVESDGYLGFLCNLTLLKKMILHDSDVRSLPDALGNLRNLELFVVDRLTHLTELPESIGTLSCLTELDIFSCHRLKSFPDSIGNLAALKSLSLDRCNKLISFPESIGNLNLQTLRIRSDVFSQLPSSFGTLISLEYLTIGGGWNSNLNRNFYELPDSIGNLNALKVFEVVRCPKLRIPDSFADLILDQPYENWSLQRVSFSRCGEMVFSQKVEQALALLKQHGVWIPET